MAQAVDPTGALTPEQIVLACSVDNDLFARVFFPTTMRQESPPGHAKVWQALENTKARLVHLKMARGWGKTTLSRLYLAKRIAYRLSRTILYIGSSETKATQTIAWLRKRIAKRDLQTGKLVPTKFAKVFGLTPGAKWNDTELEIICTDMDADGNVVERSIWILGLGITSDGIRGINWEDYRPDLIYCDDVVTDESAATEEQRIKLANLVFGAVMESLAPVADEPNAKMVVDQTPLAKGDLSDLASKSSRWLTVEVACWSDETRDLPSEEQESSWPQRYPTATLREEKQAAIAEQRYSIFAREKELRLVTKEKALFLSAWLRMREEAPPAMHAVLAIDPVPPPSDQQIARNLHDKDYECQAVCGRFGGEYHVLEYVQNRGHDPDWSVTTALSLAMKWRVRSIVVETVAYQRTLRWLIEKEMQRRRIFYVLMDAPNMGKNKLLKISSALKPLATQGRLWIGPEMQEFMEQFELYPSVQHDDVLDACAIGMSALNMPWMEGELGPAEGDEDGWDGFSMPFSAP